ncbi:hypothetical protein HID58_019765, partial [Brassica napus]
FHLLRHVFAELGTNSIRIKRQTLASDHADEQSVISQSSGRSTILKIYSARITAATSLHTVAATSQGSRNGRYPNSSHRNPSRVLRRYGECARFSSLSYIVQKKKAGYKILRRSGKSEGVFLVPWGPEDLREKMWSDFKVVKMWSDLKKKMSSLPEGVKMLSDLGDKACSELKGEDVV